MQEWGKEGEKRRDKGVWERRDEGERSERKGSTEWAKVKRKPGV